MCSTVWFLYSCGCTEPAVFQCPDSAAAAVCHDPVEPMLTPLDEECHDCSSSSDAASGLLLCSSRSRSPLPTHVLRERDVNVPTDHRAPSPGVDLPAALVQSAA
ncbi:hypothetical protein Hte_010837 [Hypoxylon texense]